ncbi:MAG TPA: hypothetical protein VGN60_07655 [Devosia sp.]|jgi:hypothetical protein|nr:hypothetical protein [Devosia sp.]
MAPERFILGIRGTTELVEVVGYRPYADASFCAHRHINDAALWVVTHATTTLRLPLTYGSQDEALAMAHRLSLECPSAASIVWDGKNDGQKGFATGAIDSLKAEVIAVIRETAQ